MVKIYSPNIVGNQILIDVKNINLEQHSLLLKLLKKESLKKAGIILILPKHILN